jgi:hypothetical protein
MLYLETGTQKFKMTAAKPEYMYLSDCLKVKKDAV